MSELRTQLTILRPKDRAAVLRKVRVEVDGGLAGHLRRATSFSINVRPGMHEVRGRLDLAETAPFRVEVAEGETVTVEIMVPRFTINPLKRRRGLVIRQVRQRN